MYFCFILFTIYDSRLLYQLFPPPKLPHARVKGERGYAEDEAEKEKKHSRPASS